MTRAIAHLLAAMVLVLVPVVLYAQNVEELQDKIEERQLSIQELEAEIAQFEEELVDIGREKQTLEGAVRELDVSRRKVNSSITLAQREIDATSATIEELETDIADKEGRIAQNQDALAQTLRRMHETGSVSFIEVLLGSDSISNVWTDMESLQQFQVVMRSEVDVLTTQRAELLEVKTLHEEEQEELVGHRTELSTQRRALDINRREKNTLLERTENEKGSDLWTVAI